MPCEFYLFIVPSGQLPITFREKKECMAGGRCFCHGGSAPFYGQGWVDGRLVAWSVVLVKVVITWVLGNLSVAIDSGPLGQESANIWVVKGGVEVLDPQLGTHGVIRTVLY